MTQQPAPSLIAFERHVARRRFDAAVEEGLRLLRAIDETMGSIGRIDFGAPVAEISPRDLHVRFATRFAAAFGDLLTQQEVVIGAHAVELLFILHRWSDMMFQLSGFQTSAHLLPRLSDAPDGRWTLTGSAMIKFLLIFSPSSALDINLDECLAANAGATVVAALGYLSVRCCVTPRAGAFRERLLEWLPGKLDNVTLGRTRLGYTAEVYMHCSYASGPGKHRIKADLIAQLRKVLLAAGAAEAAGPPPARERPRIVVVAEHFRTGHSVYRTHSRAVRALRERFHVVGVAYERRIDQGARACFDEMIYYPEGDLIDSSRAVADQILALQPDIVFHLGVGMANHAIALASLRLAPVQCVSYGHTATTMSPVIDYMILPDDFVASEEVFSEKVLRLPPEAIPYAPPAAIEPAAPPRRVPVDDGGPVRIAVPASVMKINARFLQALALIARRASRPVEFAFFPLAAVGLAHHYLEQEVRRVLPNAVVHAEQPRNRYLEQMGGCAFFLCPFPYGNMNSIIDAVIMGIPGVCLDGEEAHAHADVAIFRRLGLPEALAAASLEDYVAAAVRLVDDPDWRSQCQVIARDVDLDRRFYAGDERLFCEAMYGLVGTATA
ncbi:MAG: hypothetical protein P4L73_15530 [Caulobacteraceae bacterium]|nr:hypothetical protein [Caulobacteraceae bacterium]